MQPVKSTQCVGFEATTFNGLNAFRFVTGRRGDGGALVDGGERTVHARDRRSGQEPGQ